MRTVRDFKKAEENYNEAKNKIEQWKIKEKIKINDVNDIEESKFERDEPNKKIEIAYNERVQTKTRIEELEGGVMNSLSSIYRDQGNLIKAEECGEKSLQIGVHKSFDSMCVVIISEQRHFFLQ